MYWENYKGVALAKELRELAVILIATRGRQGYPIKDLVTRMQEIWISSKKSNSKYSET